MTYPMRSRTTSNTIDSPFEAMERVLGDWLGWRPTSGGPSETSVSTMRPAMDVSEDKDRLIVIVELPGMTKDQVELTLEDGVLTVSGEKRVVRSEEGATYHARERVAGRFRRSVKLPTDVDIDGGECLIRSRRAHDHCTQGRSRQAAQHSHQLIAAPEPDVLGPRRTGDAGRFHGGPSCLTNSR